jgi:fructokinase
MNVLAFGEILWDIIEGKQHLGGAPFNFAAHAAQCGNPSFIVSRLGRDKLGEKAFQMCDQVKVNSSLIQWDEQHATGVVDVTLKDGQPDYIIHENVAYDFIEYNRALQLLREDYFDVFYFGSLAQRSTVSSNTLQKLLTNHYFREVFYDVNLRKKGYNDIILKKSLMYCSILKLNMDEVPVLSTLLFGKSLAEEEFCKRVHDLYHNIHLMIITAADKGCMVFVRGVLHKVPGVPVKVADAVGAGDAFSAAFMHSYMQQGDALKAATVANQMGAFVASQHGPIPAYSEEIKKALAGE